MKQTLTVVLALAALSVGCHTVWIHPQATQAKFDAERAECISERQEAAARGVSAPNWKQCLLDRGWTATTDFRSAPAVRTPMNFQTPGRKKRTSR
jgi:hypothetical protein